MGCEAAWRRVRTKCDRRGRCRPGAESRHGLRGARQPCEAIESVEDERSAPGIVGVALNDAWTRLPLSAKRCLPKHGEVMAKGECNCGAVGFEVDAELS